MSIYSDFYIFTARRYAYKRGLCRPVSVCPSVTLAYCIHGWRHRL